MIYCAHLGRKVVFLVYIVNMLVEDSTGRVTAREKRIECTYRELWGHISRYYYSGLVLCGSVFDDLNLKLWEFELGRGLWRVA